MASAVTAACLGVSQPVRPGQQAASTRQAMAASSSTTPAHGSAITVDPAAMSRPLCVACMSTQAVSEPPRTRSVPSRRPTGSATSIWQGSAWATANASALRVTADTGSSASRSHRHQPSAEEELLGQRGHHDGEDQPAGVDERRGRADARQQQVARERPGAPGEQAQQREMQHRLEQQHQADAQWQELGPPAAHARARQEAGAEGQQARREQARRRAHARAPARWRAARCGSAPRRGARALQPPTAPGADRPPPARR